MMPVAFSSVFVRSICPITYLNVLSLKMQLVTPDAPRGDLLDVGVGRIVGGGQLAP